MKLVFAATIVALSTTPALADGGLFGPAEPATPSVTVEPAIEPAPPARPTATSRAASPDPTARSAASADRPFRCVSGTARCDGAVTPSRSNLTTRERIFGNYRTDY